MFYTLSEVKKHTSRHDIWIVIEGKVYDVSGFLEEVSQLQLKCSTRVDKRFCLSRLDWMLRWPLRMLDIQRRPVAY